MRFQKRFGRYTVRFYRSYVGQSVLRGGSSPFQQRLRRRFPALQPQPWPMDARHLGTMGIPFPKGEIDIDLYQHLTP